jgi:hypothetical protein
MEFGLNKTMDVLRVLLAANIPVKLESLPGAGKTSYINALFAASGGYLKTMVAVNHDPTDFGGIPVPREKFYELLPGEWAVSLSNAVSTHPLVGLFLDEINTGGRAVLAALLKVVDERIVGFQRLPDEVRIIMAMNPAEANGGVDLTPAMANRVAHLPFDYPLAAWAEAIGTGFPAPTPLTIPPFDDITAAATAYGKLVGEFAMSGATADFEKYPDEADKRSQAFPTRRTWTLGARALAAADILGVDGPAKHLALTSLVGRDAAEAFDDYLDMKSGMDPHAMLEQAETFPLPERDDALFTALDRMVNVAISQPTQAYLDAACVVLVRVAKAGRPGAGASGMRAVAVFLREHREFISDKVQDAIREFKPVIDAAGGMEA